METAAEKKPATGHRPKCPGRICPPESSSIPARGALLLLLTFIFPAANAPAIDLPAQYRGRCWTVQDGLPSNAINAIVQTRDGYLWLGTEQGLVRFDGENFQGIDTNMSSDFLAKSVTTLLEARDGSLWGGTEGGGLFRLKDRKITNFTTKEGLSDDLITSLAEDGAGRIWIGTGGKGVNIYSGGKIGAFGPGEGVPAGLSTKVEAARDGGLWVASTAGIVHIPKGGRAGAVPLPESLKNCAIMSLHEDRSGALLFGTDRGFFRLSGGRMAPAYPEAVLSGDRVLSIREDMDGNIWLCTYGQGLKRISGQAVATFGKEDGIPDLRLIAFCEDRERNIWVGTRGAGLAQLRKSTVRVLSGGGRLPEAMAYAVLEDRAGNIWIGSSGGGLSKLSGGKISSPGEKEGLETDSVFSIFEDQDGILWFGGGDGRIYHHDGARFEPLAFQRTPHPFRVSAIYRDSGGALWVGTRGGGIAVLKEGRFSIPTGVEGLAEINAHQFHESADGTIWIAASGGLWTCREGRFTRFQSNPSLVNKLVFCMYPDEHGCLWVGTYGHGLFRIKGGTVSQITTQRGLHDNIIYSLVMDETGSLWMSCNRGIFRARLSDLERLADGECDSLSCQSIGLSDGMLDIECNGGGHPAGWKGKDGSIWFPTAKGAVQVDPSKAVSNPVIPPLYIEGLKVNGKMWKAWEECRVPAGDGRLEISYSCLSYTDPSKVRFKYLMEGFDRDWVDAGSRRTAYFAGLPPGDYRFRVIGCNNDGLWNMEGASVRVSLRPPFYKSHWFTFSAWGAGLLALWLAYRIRVSLHVRRRQELERQVAERTAELREQTEVIQKMEELYRDVLEGQSELVFRISPTGEISFANGAFARFIGKAPSEIPGKNFISLLPDERREEFLTFIGSSQPSDPTAFIERESTDRSGARRLIQWSRTTLFDASGKVGGYQVVGRDITEVKKMEDILLSAQKMEAIGQLAGGVAHDFNNLLQAMLSSTETLKGKLSGERATDRVTSELKSDIRRGAQLVRQLLLYAKRERSKLEPVDLNELIRNLKEMLTRLSRENISFRVELFPGPLWVMGDTGQIEQVIVNLATNAFDSMPCGGELKVSTGEDGQGRIWFEVSDTGHGIPDDVLPHIYEPFFTTKGEEKGTGLGLPVAQSIVIQHGGTISVTSSPGSGTTFRVILQRAAAKPEAQGYAPSDESVPGKRGPGPCRVLLVEDEADVREWLSEALAMLGHSVVAVRGTVEAAGLGDATDFDIVLSDFLLQDGNGADLVRTIKARNPAIAAIIMSGYARDTAFQVAPDEPWLRFLRKPFSLEQLAEEFREALDGARGAHAEGGPRG